MDPSSPIWNANFNGEISVSQDWIQETGSHGWGNNELEDYTASEQNCFFRDGALVLKAIAAGESMTSARLTCKNTLGRDKGYVCARIVAPSASGIWPAFWLLPKEPFSWPTEGEIDIMESWNGEKVNHSCLHWGYHTGENDKHRVLRLDGHSTDEPAGHMYGMAWDQGAGRLIWYINSQPIMKAAIPAGIRPLREFNPKLNIAMGGNVMQGIKPADGEYEMIVRDFGMYDNPPGGWEEAENAWNCAPEGHGY